MFSGKASVTGAGSSQVSNPRQLPSGGPPASHDESKAPPSTSTTPRTMPPFSPNHRRTTSAPANSPSVLVQNLGSGKASATPVSGSSGSSTVQQSAKVSGRQRRTTANSYRVTPSIEPKDVSGEKISGRSSGSSLKISTPVIQVHSGSHDNVADPASKTEKALISPTTEHGESPQHPTGLPMGFPDDDKYWEEAQRRKSQVPLADVMPQEGAVRPNSGLFSRLRKTSTASAIGTHVNGKEDVQVKMETSTLPRSQKGSSARASTATQSSVHSNESPTSQNHHTKRKIHLLPHKSQKTESPLKDEEETIDIRKLQELALRLEAGIPITKPVHMEFLAHILRLIEKKELRFYEGKQEHMDCGLERATVLRKIPAGTTDKTLFPTPPEPPTKQNSPLALQIASMVPAELLFQMSPSNGTPHSFSRSSSVQKGRRHSYYDPPTTPGGSSLSAMGSIHDDKSRRSSTSDHYAETSPVQYNIPTAPIPEICEDSAATSDISLPYPIPSDSASTSTHSTQSHSSLSTIRLDAVDNSFAAKAVPPVYLPSKLNNVFASTSPSGEFEDCTMTATGSSLKRLLPRTTGTVPVFVYDEAEVCHFFNLSPEKTVHEVLLETLKGSMAEKYWNRYRMIFVDKRSGHVSEKMAYPNTPLDFFLLDPEMKEGKLEEGASCAPLTFRMRRRSTEKFRIVVKVEGKGSRSVVLDVYTTAGDVEKIMHVMEGISDEDTDDWGIFKEYAPKFGLQKILDKGKDAKEHSKQPKYYLLTPSTVIDPWDTTKLFLRRKSNARRKSSGKVQVILGIDSEKEYRKIVVQARQSMVEGKFPRKLSERLQKSQSTGSLTTIIRGSDPTETIFRPQSSGELFKGSRDVVSRDSKSLTKRGSEGNLSTKGKRSSRQNSLNEKEIADQHRRRNSMDSSFYAVATSLSMKSSSMEKDIGCLDSPSLTSLRTQSTCKSNAVCRAESKSKKIATFFGVQDKKEELTKIKSILDSNKSADARISFSLKPTFLARFFFANLTYSSLNLPIDIVASNVVPELLNKLRVSDAHANYAIFEYDQESHVEREIADTERIYDLMISWSKSETFLFKRKNASRNLLRSRSTRKDLSQTQLPPSSTSALDLGSDEGLSDARRARNRVTKLAGFFGIEEANDEGDAGELGDAGKMGSQATIALPSSTSNAKGWAKKGKGKKTAVTTSETPSDTGAASMDELLRLLNIIEKRGSVLEGLVSRNNSLTLSSKEGWLSFHDGTTWSPAWCYIRNAKFHVHLGNDQDSTNPISSSSHQKLLTLTVPSDDHQTRSTPWTTRLEEGIGNRLIKVHTISLIDDSISVSSVVDSHPAVVDGMQSGIVDPGCALAIRIGEQTMMLAAFSSEEARGWVDRIREVRVQLSIRMSKMGERSERREVVEGEREVVEGEREVVADEHDEEEDENRNVAMSMIDFEIHKVLGQGKYGTVFLCSQKSTGSVYAVKMISKPPPTSRLTVLHETEILRALQPHPFIVRLHAAFESPTHLYMAMDYVSGGELYFHVANFGRFDEPRVRFYAREVMMSLEYLHGRGFVYRDLKLENVLLSRDGHVRIADFGLSRRVEDGDGDAEEILGTLEYLAPEVLLNNGTSFASDWWAFGIILHEMLFALHPFHDDDPATIITNIHTKPLLLPPPQLSHITFSPSSLDLLRNLLIREPAKRLGPGKRVTGEGSELRDHPFFLVEETTGPPFVPEVDDDLDVRFFDEMFTDMPVPEGMVV